MRNLFSVFLRTNDLQFDSSPFTAMNFDRISNRVILQCAKQTLFSPVSWDKRTPSAGAFQKWSVKQRENYQTTIFFFPVPQNIESLVQGNAVHQEAKEAGKSFGENSSVSSCYGFKRGHWKRGKTKNTTVKAGISSMSSHTQATAERPGAFTYWMCS